MISKHIIFVPGKNPSPEEESLSKLLWRTLVEGVRRADSRVADALQGSYTHFHLVNWNSLYYHSHQDITSHIPWVDAIINKHGPTEKDIQDANSWSVWLSRALLTMGDDIPLLIQFLPEEVRNIADEISRYFENTDNVGSEVRDLLKQTLRPLLDNQDEVLLIGHSLGSVIAYDTLWELERQEGLKGKVDFLTLGSPLGLNYVKHRLLGVSSHGVVESYPELIRHWINLLAEGDVVTLNIKIKESYHKMLELGLLDSIEDIHHGIYNIFRSDDGLDCHSSYGYMVSPVVGGVIADWWMHR